jgi:hypothetical protein
VAYGWGKIGVKPPTDATTAKILTSDLLTQPSTTLRGVNHATDVVTAMLFANTIGIWVWTRTPMHIYRLVMMGGGFHIVRVV